MALAYHGDRVLPASAIHGGRLRIHQAKGQQCHRVENETNRQCHIQMNDDGGGGCWESSIFFFAVASPGNQRVIDINITFVDDGSSSSSRWNEWAAIFPVRLSSSINSDRRRRQTSTRGTW